MGTSMKSLNTYMDGVIQGTDKNISAFNKLDSSIVDLIKSGASQEEVFRQTVIAFQNMEDGVEKTKLATELFGRTGQELLPMLNANSGQIEELTAKAHELGLVMGDEAIDSGVKFTDTMDQLKRSFGTVASQIGVNVMPMFQTMADWVITNMPMIQEIMSTVFGVIKTVVDVAVEVVGWFIEQGTIMYSYFSQYLPEIQEFFGTMVTQMVTLWEENLKPMFEAIKNFVETVLVPAFQWAFEHIIGPVVERTFKFMVDMWNNYLYPVLQGIITFITGVFSGDWSMAWEGISGIFEGIWNGLVTLAKVPLNAIIGLLNGVIKAINWVINGLNTISVDIPDWGIFGDLAGKTFGINIPNISELAYLAKGGTLFDGNAIVGEAGPELLEVAGGKAKVTPLTSQQKSKGLNQGAGIVANFNYIKEPTAKEMTDDLDNLAYRLGWSL